MNSEHSLAKDSTTITGAWHRLKGRQRSRKALWWERGKASGVRCLAAAGVTCRARCSYSEAWPPRCRGREHRWLSQVGPKLEEVIKLREAVSHWWTPGPLVPTATEVMVELPALLEIAILLIGGQWQLVGLIAAGFA